MTSADGSTVATVQVHCPHCTGDITVQVTAGPGERRPDGSWVVPVSAHFQTHHCPALGGQPAGEPNVDAAGVLNLPPGSPTPGAITRTVPDTGRKDLPETPGPVCQYCLADARYTPLASSATPAERRCPVCGSAYSGPRRTRAHRLLLEAGLIGTGD